MKAVDIDEKDEMSYGDAFKANLKARRKKEEEEKRKLGFLEEGTCGYGENGKVGTKPAGSHLLEKKIKKMILDKLNK